MARGVLFFLLSLATLVFLFREENGQEITMVFDCKNAGLKNLDMEFIQFVIGRLTL